MHNNNKFVHDILPHSFASLMLLLSKTAFRDSGEILLMVETMNSVQTSLENVLKRLTSVVKILADGSVVASETFASASDSVNNWASTNAERLDENQRAMLLKAQLFLMVENKIFLDFLNSVIQRASGWGILDGRKGRGVVGKFFPPSGLAGQPSHIFQACRPPSLLKKKFG